MTTNTDRSPLCLSVAACALSLLAPAAAHAQMPGASSGPSPDAAVAQELTSQPIPGRGGIVVSAGGNLQLGRTEMEGWSIQGVAANTTKKGLLLKARVKTAVTTYSPGPDLPVYEIENNREVSGLLLHRLRSRMSWVGTTGWRQDKVLQMDHRAWVEGGIGLHILEAPPINLMVAPMFTVGSEHRTYTTRGSTVADLALLQQFSWRKVGYFSIDEYVESHVDTTDTYDKSLTFNVSLQTKLAPHTGLTLYYQYQYDALAPPGVDSKLKKIGVALTISIVKTPPADTSKPATPPAAQTP